MLVITLAVQVSVQVASALQLLALLQSAGATARRIESLRATASAAADRVPGGAAPERLHRGIALEQVSFRYPGAAEPVLRDVNLRIRADQTLALVGENGAGKSTLVKLLCTMYQPSTQYPDDPPAVSSFRHAWT